MLICSFGTLSAQNTVLTNPSSCGLNLALTDNSCPSGGASGMPDQFDIVVNNAPGTALGSDVYLQEVRLIINHTWAADLDIELTSPGGITVELTSDNGGGQDNYGEFELSDCTGYTSLDATSCISVTAGEAPFTSQSYLPEESLLLFNDGTTAPNGTWVLRICDDVEADTGTLQYVELVFASTSCLPVSQLEVDRVDTTTVVLDWADNGLCNNSITIIEYGPAGFQPGSGNQPGEGDLITAVCPPYAVTDLGESFAYDFYVRRVCGPQESTDNSCVVSAATECDPPDPAVREPFDALPTCAATCPATCLVESPVWRNTIGDDTDWIIYNGPTPNHPVTGPAGDAGGVGNYAYLEVSGACPQGTAAFLNSGCFSLDKRGVTTCHLSFDYHMFGINIGTLRLQITTDGGNTWTTLWERSGDQSPNWRKAYVSLDAYENGQIVQFRFVAEKGNGSRGDIAIDNPTVHGSVYQGLPAFRYFADQDEDGFGAVGNFITTCLPEPPAGFVTDSTDCNDTDPLINPGRTEFPCDTRDNDCNPMTVDSLIPPPVVMNDTTCSGAVAMVSASSLTGRDIFWYDADGRFLAQGQTYFPTLPENNSIEPQVYSFFAEESDGLCQSLGRAEATVTVFPRPRITVGESPIICQGEQVDLATVEIEDAIFAEGEFLFYEALPPLGFALDTTVVDPTESTIYFVRKRTPAGCIDTDSILVTVNPSPEIIFTPAETITICKEATQTILTEIEPPTGEYTYRWSTGEETAFIEVTAADTAGTAETYALTVTNAEGCADEGAVDVVTTNNIDSIRRQTQDVTSCQGDDGSIILIPLNGIPPYTYEWESSNGTTGDTTGVADTLEILNLRQGAYRITITDNSEEGCQFFVPNTYVNGPGAEVVDVSVNNVSCADAQDGAICLDIFPAIAQIQWSTGATSTCIENLAGGTYSVTVTNAGCSTVIEDIVVEEPRPLEGFVDRTIPTCPESDDGSIDLTTFGGVEPYRFLWSNGRRNQDIGGLTGGQYTVTITDASGCEHIDSFELIPPAELIINADDLNDVQCFGEASGSILVGGQGGNAPYQFQWDRGDQTPLLLNATSRDYVVTMTDFNGCVTTDTFAVNQPDSLTINLLDVVEPNCFGDETGSILVAGEGGIGPYDFLWSNGENDFILSGLGVGQYDLVLQDANGCVADTFSVTLTADSELNLTANIADPSCVGATDGAIILNTDPDLAPYTYQWSTGSMAKDLTNVGVGAYTVTITDIQDCIYDTTFVLNAPQIIRTNIIPRAPTCADRNDGSIRVDLLQSGTPPLAFAWNNGSSDRNLTELGTGAYQLTITDFNGCNFISDSIPLESPEPFTFKLIEIGDNSCAGDTSGFIELELQGGTQPYSNTWVGTDLTTPSIYNLSGGEYRLSAQDGNNCTLDTNFQVGEPVPLTVTLEIDNSAVCEGDTTNRIEAAPSGGRPPYTYAWSNGSNQRVLNNLPPGDYELTVTDVNGCTFVPPSAKITPPGEALQLVAFTTTDISCNGQADGAMTATVAGGRPPYRFHFSNNCIEPSTFERTYTCDGLAFDEYDVTVTDQNGCRVVSDFQPVDEPPLLSLRRDGIVNDQCFQGGEGAVEASTFGGTSPFLYVWKDATGDTVSTQEDLTNVAEGTYFLRVTDANGCIDTLRPSTILSENPPVLLVEELLEVIDVSCQGDSTGLIDLTFESGAPPYTYRWNTGATTQDLRNLKAGDYQMTLTDSEGCTFTFGDFTVREPMDPLAIAQERVLDTRCYLGADGEISIQLNGGDPPFMITWENGGRIFAIDTTRITGLSPGAYSLQVIDGNGCTLMRNYTVDEPPPLEIIFQQQDSDTTDQFQTITAIPSGGTPDYRYLWSTGETTQTVQLLPGTYSVTIVDGNNCSASKVFVVTNVLEPDIVESVSLAPNPTSGQTTLNIQMRQTRAVSLELYDQQGRLLEQTNLGRIKRLETQIDLSAYPGQVYYLRLQSGGLPIYSGSILRIRE